VGDLDIEEFEDVVKENVEPGLPLTLVKKEYKEPDESVRNESVLEMNLQVPNYIYGVKVKRTGADLLKETLVGSVAMKLIFGSTSDFYEENIKNGRINDSFSSEISLEEDHGEVFIGGESRDPEMVLNLIEEYVEHIKTDKEFFSKMESDLKRIKKAMTGKFVNIFNSVDRIGVSTTGLLLHGEDLFSYVEKIKNISINDVETKFYEIFSKDRSTKVTIK